MKIRLKNKFKFQDNGAFHFLDMEAEVSSDTNSEPLFEPTEADKYFIDDSSIKDVDNTLEIQREHCRNVKRIAKNLDEF